MSRSLFIINVQQVSSRVILKLGKSFGSRFQSVLHGIVFSYVYERMHTNTHTHVGPTYQLSANAHTLYIRTLLDY